jgi:hypothetical protein
MGEMNAFKRLRALVIDSDAREIREYENTGLESLQKAVGGYIEHALWLPGGDVLFVNEEGLLRLKQSNWFSVVGARQPFVGNGVVVGPVDRNGDEQDATISAEALGRLVRFASLEDLYEEGSLPLPEPRVFSF